MAEIPEETPLDCVRGATEGLGGHDGASGFRGATLKPGPNVNGDCVLEAESPWGGSALWEEELCVDVEGPADMFLCAVN